MKKYFYRILYNIHRMLDKGYSEYLKSRMRCGEGVTLRENALIYCPERVNLADGVTIGSRVTIMAQGGVDIGTATMVGPGVTILSVNHDFSHSKDAKVTQRKRAVKIGREVWIAGGAIILPGVKVGDYAVVAAGAVVTRDVPPNTIVAGVPAKHVRERFRTGPKKNATLSLFDDAPVPTRAEDEKGYDF
jgi:acetyltransferase-like isoleucine patch superfamily enzyme